MAKLERTEKSINVIIEERHRGELGLPEIQRGYVWKQAQARDLIESMYKEYPCGLILLWKPPSELLKNLKMKESIISSEIVSRDKVPTFLVLDGQQRITSILKVLDGSIEVYFNVEDEKFEIKSPKIKGNPYWISITRLFKEGATKIWRDLKKNIPNQNDEIYDLYLERLTRIERIKEYRIPVEILHTDDYEEITEAFIRINSKGTKLREAELALAQLALKLPGMVSMEFEKALDEYEENNFYFEIRFLMRCFVAVATGQSKFKYLNKLWQLSEKDLTNIWNRTKAGLDHAINFLRTNLGIESSDWIPSLNSIVPLVALFAQKTHLTEKEEKLMIFWYFSANLWGRYSGSVESKLDQDLDALLNKEKNSINEDGIEKILKNCRRDVSDFIVDQEELIELYQRSAFMPLLFSIVRKRRAKDWFNGIELSATNVGPDNKIELHHFFPRSVLKSKGVPRKLYDDLSNIVFLSRKANREIRYSMPIDYIKRNNIEESRLASQFIPLDENLWKIENFEKFLILRRKMIAEAMNEYLTEYGRSFMKTQQDEE